jgi:hypothetical protein
VVETDAHQARYVSVDERSMDMSTDGNGGEKSGGKPDWLTEVEDAFEKVGDSIGAAWEATRDQRMSALEAAKRAAKQLGDAIDRGVEVARSQWRDTGGSPTAPAEEE